jgi:hypothetical protein
VTAALRRFLAGLRLRLLLTILVVPVMAGCARPPRDAEDALDAAQAVYSLSCVALEVADAGASAWLRSLDAPTETDIARGEQMVAALVLAHDALVEARAALVAGRDGLAEVRDALSLLRGVASLLGAQAPPGLVTALDAAERVIGGGS